MIFDLMVKFVKAWTRNRAWVGLTILAVAFTVVANPSAKPPRVAVSVVVETSTKAITITPSCKESDKAKFEGRVALIQLRKFGPRVPEDSWETIKRIESFTFEPITINGVFVSGGRDTLRQIRIVFE